MKKKNEIIKAWKKMGILERGDDHVLSCLQKDNLEFVENIFPAKDIRNIFDKRYCDPCFEFKSGESQPDCFDYNRDSAFSNTAHFLNLFFARLETEGFKKRFWKKRHVSARIKNGNNRNPFFVNVHFKLHQRAVNFSEKRASIALVRESHRNNISVSFLGTKASTGLLPGCFLLATFQTEYAELPEATILLPMSATCLPLCLSNSGENFAKKSTSFISITNILQPAKHLKLFAIGENSKHSRLSLAGENAELKARDEMQQKQIDLLRSEVALLKERVK